MTSDASDDSRYMLQALELARRGQGFVEPNPMVGAVIVSGGHVVAEGWHQRFGGPHAEVEALKIAGTAAAGATLYVTLEPCSHHGKTPPCTDAIIAAGIKRVVAAMQDPFPKVSGGGFKRLTEVGIVVDVGMEEVAARALNAPYLKLLSTGRPWVMAKWAMTLDGKIATRSGQSKWISGEESREIVQQLRSRVDAIAIGRRTAELDDPMLVARCSSVPRVATRVVLDSQCRLSLESQLVKTARQFPVLIAAGPGADQNRIRGLRSAGCEVFCLKETTSAAGLAELLNELGRRQMTNLLVEGGSQLLGAMFDAGQIDEVHVFIAPRLFGGEQSPSPIGGMGIEHVPQSHSLVTPTVRQVGSDSYIQGRVVPAQPPRS